LASYTPMHSMGEMSERIHEAIGKSCNIELVPHRVKIGGQGPIFTRALVEGGHFVTLVGLLGEERIETVFEPLIERAHLISLGPSSQTLAIEFQDGKVMLGKHQSVHEVTWDTLLAHIPLPDLIALHESVDLFLSGNWTMLPGTTGIWRGFVQQVVPQLSDRPRWMYVDLADPAKRPDADLREALALLAQLMVRYRVVLGLNVSEAQRVGLVYGMANGSGREALMRLAKELVLHLGLAQVVIHAIDYAVGATAQEVECVAGPGSPAILTTGGGDNFNAGYCHALLNHLPLRQALLCGVAVSGFYVSQARSPTMRELASFLRLWHDHPNGLSAALSLQDSP
jgi:hypothetical protein